MSRGRSKPRGKKINPKLWVFCEGESEATYVSYLRSKYRLPSIKIISKVTGASISEREIRNHKTGEASHEKDKTFLMYDGDLLEVISRLKQIANVDLLITTPCLELWYLLHYTNHRTALTSAACEQKLKQKCISYKKGVISSELKMALDKNIDQACLRVKTTELFKNPSSNIYEFTEMLEQINRLK